MVEKVSSKPVVATPSASVSPALPAEVQDENFRLSEDVLPKRHVATLKLDPEKQVFQGKQTVELSLKGERKNYLVLHAKDLDVTNATLEIGGRTLRPIAIQKSPSMETQRQNGVKEPKAGSDTVVLQFAEPLPRGKAKLAMEWSGAYSDGLRGLYQAGPVALTQFEPVEARTVFPSFDEPGIKPRWQLTIEAPKSVNTVLSNGREIAKTDLGDAFAWKFKETKPLQSYLVAFVAGDLVSSKPVYTEGTKLAKTLERFHIPVSNRFAHRTEIRTWATPDKAALTEYPQQFAKSTIEYFEGYFGHRYAFDKSYLVGIPNFEVGAMENAGVITYRETDLLVDPVTASLASLKREVEVVDHEHAHQWNGNLVSPKWWNDLWLNESFATFMAAKAENHQMPEWRIYTEANEGREYALGLDGLSSTHPIRAEIKNAGEANQAFDVITYEKGGAVLRMLESYVGEDVFRDGIQHYIKKNKYKAASAESLWKELDAAVARSGSSHLGGHVKVAFRNVVDAVTHRQAAQGPASVTSVVNAWINQEGFPVVNAQREGDTLKLSQERFFSEPGKKDDQVWPIPVIVRFEDSTGVHERRLLMNEKQTDVKLDAVGEVKWAVANGDSVGNYRVNYSDADRNALTKNLAALTPDEKIELVNDEYAMFQSGRRTLREFLDFASKFSTERDYAVLGTLVGQLSNVKKRFASEDEKKGVEMFARKLFQPMFDEVGWDPKPGETHDQLLLRATVVSGLGGVGRDPMIAKESLRRVKELLAGNDSAAANDLKGVITSIAARAGDQELFDAYVKKAAASTVPTEKIRYLALTASFENPAIAKKALALAFTPAVPSQDFSSYVASLMANPTARDLVWSKMKTDWSAFENKAGGASIVQRLVKSIAAIPGQEHFDEAKKFFETQHIPDADRTIRQTIESMKQAIELRQRAGDDVSTWLAAQGVAPQKGSSTKAA